MSEDRQEPRPGVEDGSGIVIRLLSVAPFLLLAVFGLIGVVGWFFVFIFGAGPGVPIWEAVRGHSPAEVARQVLLLLLLGLAPLAVVLAASWATGRGFREDSGRMFWSVVEAMWSLAGLGSLYVWTMQRDLIGRAGLSSADWWFIFGLVAFAVVCAGVRLRRAPQSALS